MIYAEDPSSAIPARAIECLQEVGQNIIQFGSNTKYFIHVLILGFLWFVILNCLMLSVYFVYHQI